MSPLPRGEERDRLIGLVAFFAFCTLGCGGTQAEGADTGAAVLAIHGAPGSAQIYIDDHPRGTIERTGGSYLVQAGARRLRVTSPGYLSLWFDLELDAREAYDLDVQMWPCFADIDSHCEPYDDDSVLERIGENRE